MFFTLPNRHKYIAMLSRLLIFSFYLTFLCHCGNNTSTSPDNNTSAAVTNTTAPATATYQSIPVERLLHLWENATHMDVVFYELPVSLNQSSLESIRTTLAHIAEEVPTISPNCKSIGRIFFQVGQENVESAEIYFQPGCTFYLWLENDKPAYANQMDENGVKFYNNIFQSVKSQSAPQ